MALDTKPFLIISPRQCYLTERLQEEAVRAGFLVAIVDVNDLDQAYFTVAVNQYSGLYIRQAHPHYSQLLTLAQGFKAAGKPVVDDITTDNFDTSKWSMYERLRTAGIRTPNTRLLPEVDRNVITYPCIVKWIHGFQARGVFFVHTPEELELVAQKHPANELMVQEYIKGDWEYKVICVGYRSLPIVVRHRINADGFRVNLAEYEVISTNSSDELIKKVIDAAERSCKVLGRQLSKVDILVRAGELYVLEANRWPGLDTIEPICGFNIVGEFVKYLKG